MPASSFPSFYFFFLLFCLLCPLLGTVDAEIKSLSAEKPQPLELNVRCQVDIFIREVARHSYPSLPLLFF